MDKLLLVDGHNLLFKAFYGIPERLLPDGTPVQGLIGFIGMLMKMLRQIRPTYILVVFDPDERPLKQQLYSEYKANRHDYGGLPDRENPFSQLSQIKKALDHLGITWLEETGYEADDMIASYAGQVPCEVVIVSSDTDFLQLVSEKTTMFRYGGKNSTLFTETYVQEKYGVHPTRFVEYKALIGDKTDNIDGVKGIGPKNALKVLNNQKELDEEGRRLFERNCSLIKLDCRIELPYELEQLSFTDNIEGFDAYEFLNNIGVL
jgi:DNA polymerase-1